MDRQISLSLSYCCYTSSLLKRPSPACCQYNYSSKIDSATASIKRYLKLFREDKDLAAKDYKRGKKPAITDEMLPELADFVQKEHQNSTIMEISKAYSKKIGCTEFKKDVMHSELPPLKRAGLTHKKVLKQLPENGQDNDNLVDSEGCACSSSTSSQFSLLGIFIFVFVSIRRRK